MKIAIFGDIILDKYIIGSTSRISPEAPVPIVKKTNDYATLGGAANVAYNISKLGKDVTLYGAIGDDESGSNVLTLCDELNISTQFFKSASIPTTTKTRVISRNQQMLRIDNEQILEDKGKLNIINIDKLNSYTIIGISDYAKGYIDGEIMNIIAQAKHHQCKIIVDPKGRNWEKYKGAFLIKPNINEVEDALNITIKNNDEDVAKAAIELLKRFDIEHILVTRSEKGMTLVNNEGITHFAAKKVDVYDVSGAGDTSLAVLINCLADSSDLDTAIKHAIIASTYVVTKPMTYAISKQELDDLVKVQ
jgi:D-glycero-beta-D-manno-heptose-7-phosphate kinase